MKVTRTVYEYNKKQQLKNKALRGCNICPCCGETKKYIEYLRQGVDNKGILNGTYRSYYGRIDEEDRSIFSSIIPHESKHWKIECFSCLTCGAKWESDPYER